MKNRLFITAILSFLIGANCFAQIIQQNQQTQQTTTQSNVPSSQNLKINTDAPDLLSQFSMQSPIQQQTFAIDKAVNPNNYIVGPNDVFNLGLYGSINQVVSLTVNLEGSIVIPTVGEIKVFGLTLTDAKSKVIAAVKKRYFSSDVSFTLATPRSFLISVSSIIQNKYQVSPLTRPSDVISMVFYDTLDVSKVKYKYINISRDDFFKSDISLRNIKIERKDGSVLEVDLYKYFMTNDDKYNPYLREEDILKVPYGQLIKNYVSVEGAVQLAGTYEYNVNDNLETVIGLARGFDSDAEPDSITVFRIDPESKKYTVINIAYGDNKNFKINVFDRVFVKYKTNYLKNVSVTILGEVVRPGIYPVTFKNTTLKEVIEMAGGFKPTAYLPLCVVFRRYDEEYSKKDSNEIFINMRANDLIINEKDKLAFERDVLSKRNRVVVDFEKLFKYNDTTQNIILDDKDVIYINDDKKVVYVYGQVGFEGFVPYVPGKDYEYYIEKAGGYSLAADEGNTRIIKFNSRGWYKPDDIQILSGDFVYVPKKSPVEFKETFAIIAATVAIVTSLITTYLLIRQENK
ncbi:MAG: SLBB domain-containing protein [Ignavibacteria bacterium]|jgi:protein involved in polysaccharide export with SLBB domain|nr:SLBB domain-containing protein [Ignavibacteria bacterium]